MPRRMILLVLATISGVIAQPDYYDALRDPVGFWSDYGDYLARVLGDTVSVITAGQDTSHTTYHLSCAGPSASMDAYGCVVGNGATVVRGQNIINIGNVENGETFSQRCTSGPTESAVCTIVQCSDDTSSATTMTVDQSDMGLVTPWATRTQTTDSPASTRASPTVNTASATESVSNTDQSVTEPASEITATSDTYPATETTDNAGYAQVPGNAWAFGCAAMAIALAVI